MNHTPIGFSNSINYPTEAPRNHLRLHDFLLRIDRHTLNNPSFSRAIELNFILIFPYIDELKRIIEKCLRSAPDSKLTINGKNLSIYKVGANGQFFHPHPFVQSILATIMNEGCEHFLTAITSYLSSTENWNIIILRDDSQTYTESFDLPGLCNQILTIRREKAYNEDFNELVKWLSNPHYIISNRIFRSFPELVYIFNYYVSCRALQEQMHETKSLLLGKIGIAYYWKRDVFNIHFKSDSVCHTSQNRNRELFFQGIFEHLEGSPESFALLFVRLCNVLKIESFEITYVPYLGEMKITLPLCWILDLRGFYFPEELVELEEAFISSNCFGRILITKVPLLALKFIEQYIKAKKNPALVNKVIDFYYKSGNLYDLFTENHHIEISNKLYALTINNPNLYNTLSFRDFYSKDNKDPIVSIDCFLYSVNDQITFGRRDLNLQFGPWAMQGNVFNRESILFCILYVLTQSNLYYPFYQKNSSPPYYLKALEADTTLLPCFFLNENKNSFTYDFATFSRLFPESNISALRFFYILIQGLYQNKNIFGLFERILRMTIALIGTASARQLCQIKFYKESIYGLTDNDSLLSIEDIYRSKTPGFSLFYPTVFREDFYEVATNETTTTTTTTTTTAVVRNTAQSTNVNSQTISLVTRFYGSSVNEIVSNFFKNRIALAEALESGVRSWVFSFEDSYFKEFVASLVEFLQISKDKSRSLEAIKKIVPYFPLRNKNGVDLHKSMSQEEKDILSLFLDQDCCPYFLNKEQTLSEEFLPTLIELKFLEINAQNGGAKNPSPQNSSVGSNEVSIPAFIIREKKGVLKANPVHVILYKNLFIGFRREENPGQVEKKLKENGVLVPQLVEQNRSAFTPKELVEMKNILLSSTSKIPSFLIINFTSLQPEVSSNRVPNSSLSKEVGKKRPLVINLDDDGTTSPQKRARVEASQNTPSQQQAKSVISLPSTQAIEVMLPLNSDSFWRNLTLNELQVVSRKISFREIKKGLFLDKPHSYPIRDILRKEISLPPFKPLHPLLKPYQTAEVEKQLEVIKKGLSRPIAFEMGLGKTYVLLETCAQLILSGSKGAFIFVVLKSATKQIADEAKEYFSIISAIAWSHRFQNTEVKDQPNLIKIAIEKSLLALKNNLPESFFSLFPLLSYMQGEKLYDLFLGQNGLEENSGFFWKEIRKFSEKILSSIPSDVLLDLHKRLAPELKTFILSTERGASERWLESGKDNPHFFHIGEPIAGITFKPPLLFAQILYTAKLLRKYFQENKIRIPHLETYKDGLKNLADFPVEVKKGPNDIVEGLSHNHGILITHYEAFLEVNKEILFQSNLGGVFFDEAQRLHTSKSVSSEKALQITRGLKEKNPELPLIVVTATLLENKFSELWTLLRIANPADSAFQQLTYAQLEARINKVQKGLLSMLKKEDESQFETLSQLIVLAFSHLEAFRQRIFIPLVGRKEREDEDVQKSWNYLTPKKVEVTLDAELSDEAEKLIKATLEENSLQENKNDQFVYTHKIKRILLHPSFVNSSLKGEDPEISKAEKLLLKGKAAEKEAWIAKSPLLFNLFNAHVFKEVITNKKSALIYTEHLKTASIVKLAVDSLSTKEIPIECRTFVGTQSLFEREANLAWFKEKTAAPKVKIFVLSKKIGSASLNLGEADSVFILDDNWNPSIDKQAAARILRINIAGTKTIVRFRYDSFFYEHIEAVRNVKNQLEEFFHQKPQKSLREQFLSFKNLILSQIYQGLLNESKDSMEAQLNTDILANLFDTLTIDLGDDELEYSLNSVLPQ